MGWIVRLVEAGAEGPGVEIMEIGKPDDLGDIANLGLTLAEAKQLLAGVQREISSAQAKGHAIRRPVCPCSDGVCQVKDYRDHSVARLFGQVTMRLARFRCAACRRIETGINWPSHCRSTPELDRLRAHLSALMTYRVGADLLEQMLPVDAGIDPRTLRRRTLKAGAAPPTVPRSGRRRRHQRSRSPWIPPSSGAARMKNITSRCGLAMSKRRLAAVRFSAASRKPERTSKG